MDVKKLEQHIRRKRIEIALFRKKGDYVSAMNAYVAMSRMKDTFRAIQSLPVV